MQLGYQRGRIPIEIIAHDLGITEIRNEALTDLEGMLLTTPERDYGSILLNSKSPRPRQRFTIRHELGHFPPPQSFAALWFDALLLGVEAQMVIGLRCTKLALNGKGSAAERRSMISEKPQAASAAQRTTIKGLVSGSGNRAGTKVIKLYRRRVRANLRRLAKGK